MRLDPFSLFIFRSTFGGLGKNKIGVGDYLINTGIKTDDASVIRN